jgi:hypothetical protein
VKRVKRQVWDLEMGEGDWNFLFESCLMDFYEKLLSFEVGSVFFQVGLCWPMLVQCFFSVVQCWFSDFLAGPWFHCWFSVFLSWFMLAEVGSS